MAEGIEKMPQIEISAARPEEAQGIQELLRASVFNTYPNEAVGISREDIESLYEKEFSSEGLEGIAKNLAEPKAGVNYFVAKENDKVIGYCHTIEEDKENRLVRLHVLPDRKRERVGTLLWNKAQTVLNPRKDTTLWVANYTEEAIAAYKKWGFEETEERREELLQSGTKRVSIRMVRKAQNQRE